MLEDSDVRSRALVIERGFTAGKGFFSDKKRAARLMAVADKEREGSLIRGLGKFVAIIDGEKLFPAEFKAFPKHPSSDFRRAIAEYLLPKHPSAFSLDIVKAMMGDADTSVRHAAVGSLSSSGRTRPTPAICDTLKAQATGDGDSVDEALDAATSSKCAGMHELVVSEIEKRAAADKLGALGNISYKLSSVCYRSENPEALKKRVFDLAVKQAGKGDDSWRRRSLLDLFRSCDLARATDALKPYLTDKDKDVAEEAKSETARVDEELKRARQ